MNTLEAYLDHTVHDSRNVTVWLDTVVNSQWTTDQSRSALLAAFLDEVRLDGNKVLSLADLKPLPDPPLPVPMASDPRNDQAKAYYDKATEIYNEASRERNSKGFQSAINLCNEAVKVLVSMPGGGDKSLLRNIYNKIIQSYMALDAYEKVVESCNLVLRDVDPTEAKTLYKRALAYEKLDDYDNAMRDIERVSLVYNEPDTKNYREVMDVKTRILEKSWRMKWIYTFDEILELYRKYFSFSERNSTMRARKMEEVREELQTYVDNKNFRKLNSLGQKASSILKLNQVTLGKYLTRHSYMD